MYQEGEGAKEEQRMQHNEAERIAQIASAIRTKARVELLFFIGDGKRPSEVLRRFSESPTTIYRAVDSFVNAQLVERLDMPDGVVWRLTPMGKKLANNLMLLFNADTSSAQPSDENKDDRVRGYLTYLVPSAIFAVSLGQAAYWSMPSWIAGGIILSAIVYILLRRFR
ncbi:MAG: MarR family winged helix-turn-helix transcriptional regulator [Conexivisphaerales archaeon]